MCRRTGFTLIELLIVISCISILSMLLMPVMARARGMARSIHCGNDLRQIGHAWMLYSQCNDDYCMPQAMGLSPKTYWWGLDTNPPDHRRGLLHRYLAVDSGRDTVFDCPEQPWGSYPYVQGASRTHATTTYGYNGLYLAAPASNWVFGSARHEVRWRTMDEIASPSLLFVFADTLIDHGSTYGNTCLLDGPMIPRVCPGGTTTWSTNAFPTLCFRHKGSANVFHADGHIGAYKMADANIASDRHRTGSIGDTPAPHYVPYYESW